MRRRGGRRELRRRKVTVGQMARYTALALNRAEANRARRMWRRVALGGLVLVVVALVGAVIGRAG